MWPNTILRRLSITDRIIRWCQSHLTAVYTGKSVYGTYLREAEIQGRFLCVIGLKLSYNLAISGHGSIHIKGFMSGSWSTSVARQRSTVSLSSSPNNADSPMRHLAISSSNCRQSAGCPCVIGVAQLIKVTRGPCVC